MTNEQGTYSVYRSGVNNSTLIPFPDFNETIHFGGDSKTYKELIYTSRVKDTLNLSIDILTNDSETSRLALRNERKKNKGMKELEIPRPQNPWIIYRRDKYADPEFEGIKSCDASGKIGKKWRSEDNEVVEYFVALSMLALENHQKKYGNYKYQPKSKASKKSKNRQRQQHKENTSSPKKMISTFTEKTTLNQDLPQFVVNPSSPYLPTPVSSIQHSPANDFLEQANDYSYLMTPASSNHQSPVTSDTLTPELLNQHTPITSITSEDILSLMNFGINPIAMVPQLSAITPTNDFSAYNNNSLAVSEYVLKFMYYADILASLQSSTNVTFNNDTTPAPDMTFNNDIQAIPTDIPGTLASNMTFNNDIQAIPTDIPATLETLPDNSDIQATTNMNDQIEDFCLYSDNDESEELISDIIPLAAETMSTSMENQLYQALFEYDSNDLFSINATPSPDQFDYYNNNGLSL